jgi:phosphate starvation-inducible membrane PsiE
MTRHIAVDVVEAERVDKVLLVSAAILLLSIAVMLVSIASRQRSQSAAADRQVL